MRTGAVGFEAARALALALPLLLMAGALGSEHFGGLYPCEMCIWQRKPHYAAIALAALAFVVPDGAARILVALAGIAILVSGGIGVFHAGVEYGWWQGVTACSSTVAAGAGGDIDALLDRIMKAPLIRCDVAQWKLLGISLAGFNALFSLAGGLAVLLLLSRKQVA
jgi:disulfide bond formation protein DsbB